MKVEYRSFSKLFDSLDNGLLKHKQIQRSKRFSGKNASFLNPNTRQPLTTWKKNYTDYWICSMLTLINRQKYFLGVCFINVNHNKFVTEVQ